MPTYALLSKVTDDGAGTIRENPDRIKEVNQEVESFGATIRAQYALLGEYDFLTIVDAPDNETISRVSVELGARGSVTITTMGAIPIDEFIANVRS